MTLPGIHPKASPLDISKHGAFALLGDDSLITVDGTEVCISSDDGRTWECRPLFDNPDTKASWEFAILRTVEGAIVVVYMDLSTRNWGWDNEAHKPIPDARCEVWSTRSLDEGKTWSKPVRLYDGWCGAIINIIQTRSGRIVVPVQRLLYHPGRHAQATYASADQGATWTRSNIIDFGGHGHHDGICEGALVELQDGRVWMVLRTTLERFWQAFSDDDGSTWRVLTPTDIDASSAPAYVTRLASGRLVMAWNRVYAEGLTDREKAGYPRRGGDCNLAEKACSWQRKELSIAFSKDDGKTWTDPEVLIRHPEKGVAYPFILERRPGLIWITSRFTERTGVWINEEEFV